MEWVEAQFPQRSLIVLGDLVHRGPDSRRCLKTALQWAESGRAVLLWGNHEFWIWDEGLHLSGDQRDTWFRSNESELLSQYKVADESISDLIRDFERFSLLAQPYHVEGDMLCAHASRPSLGMTPHDVLDNGYLWDKPEIGLHPLPTHFFPALTYSVHGHSTFDEPLVDRDGEGVIYLDLGGYKTGQFCVWDAEAQRIIFYDE